MNQTSERAPGHGKSRSIGIVLFNAFETLDVFGPVQMLGRLPDHRLITISQDGHGVASSQGLVTDAHFTFATVPQLDVILVPGGQGTRSEIDNCVLLDFLRYQSARTKWVTSVCTGAALLAKAGVLDGRNATTNKISFDWVAGQSSKVNWQRKARWVVDDKFMTSSGVSAGTDMALDLVTRLYRRAVADEIARRAEYVWNDDPENDPFAQIERSDN